MAEAEADRRHDQRVEKIHLVQVSRFDEEGFRADLAAGRTLNLSRGGMRLELYHPLPLRSQVSLSLLLGDEVVEVHGRVTYLEELDEDRCAMGIEFVDLSTADEARIGRILDAAARGPAA